MPGYHILIRRIRFQSRQDEEWPESARLVEPGRCVLIDGLGTSSKPPPESQRADEDKSAPPRNGTYPWFEVMQEENWPVPIHGFSYRRSGFHYWGEDTDKSVLDDSEDLLRDYCPPGAPTWYLTFSLGGPIAITGIASSRPAIIPPNTSIILIQPGFALDSEAGKYFGSLNPPVVPTAILDSLKDRRGELLAALLDFAEELISAGGRVRVLYWDRLRKGDGFVTYPESLLTSLVAIGAELQRLEIPEDQLPKDELLRHLAIRDHEVTADAIHLALAEGESTQFGQTR